jgi:hypothetical protein
MDTNNRLASEFRAQKGSDQLCWTSELKDVFHRSETSRKARSIFFPELHESWKLH